MSGVGWIGWLQHRQAVASFPPFEAGESNLAPIYFFHVVVQ